LSSNDDQDEALRNLPEGVAGLALQFGKEFAAVQRLNEDIARWGQQQSRIAEQLETSLAPLREANSQLAKSFLAFGEIAAHAAQSIPRISLPTALQQAVEEAARFQRRIAEAFADLPERTRDELHHLAERGWYIDSELPAAAPAELVKAIEDGQAREVDDALVEYFGARIVTLKERLVRQYPHRAPFFSKAFAAHERGDFELSIPVFLAQADGICKERTNRLLFRRKGNKPEIAKYVETHIGVDTYRAALMSPLAKEHPISLSESQRPPEFNGLNRHQVLHGESITYHTEINSLKAVSLLAFLSWVLHFDDGSESPVDTK
jgi:hypothetical protein